MDCIVHIGTEATGTTLLQDWLYKNQKALSKSGVFLSNILGITNNRRIVSYFQNEIDDWCNVNLITSQAEKHAHFKDFETTFAHEICEADKKHHTIIITSEHFHSRLVEATSIEKLRDFLLTFFSRVKIVCYFREQSDMSRSSYSTALKSDCCETLQQFRSRISEETYYYNLYEIAKNWADVFGRDNCYFRIYDSDFLQNRDLRRDFLSALFRPVSVDKLSFDELVSNKSLSRLEARLFKMINEELPFFNYDNDDNRGLNQFNIALKRTIMETKDVKIERLDRKYDHEIAHIFMESNEKLSEEFFDGQSLFRDMSYFDASDYNKEYSFEDVAGVVVALMRNLINDHIKPQNDMQNSLDEARRNLAEAHNAAEREVRRLHRTIDQMTSSSSWRLTRLWRSIGRLTRAVRSRPHSS